MHQFDRGSKAVGCTPNSRPGPLLDMSPNPFGSPVGHNPFSPIHQSLSKRPLSPPLAAENAVKASAQAIRTQTVCHTDIDAVFRFDRCVKVCVDVVGIKINLLIPIPVLQHQQNGHLMNGSAENVKVNSFTCFKMLVDAVTFREVHWLRRLGKLSPTSQTHFSTILRLLPGRLVTPLCSCSVSANVTPTESRTTSCTASRSSSPTQTRPQHTSRSAKSILSEMLNAFSDEHKHDAESQRECTKETDSIYYADDEKSYAKVIEYVTARPCVDKGGLLSLDKLQFFNEATKTWIHISELMWYDQIVAADTVQQLYVYPSVKKHLSGELGMPGVTLPYGFHCDDNDNLGNLSVSPPVLQDFARALIADMCHQSYLPVKTNKSANQGKRSDLPGIVHGTVTVSPHDSSKKLDLTVRAETVFKAACSIVKSAQQMHDAPLSILTNRKSGEYEVEMLTFNDFRNLFERAGVTCDAKALATMFNRFAQESADLDRLTQSDFRGTMSLKDFVAWSSTYKATVVVLYNRLEQRVRQVALQEAVQQNMANLESLRARTEILQWQLDEANAAVQQEESMFESNTRKLSALFKTNSAQEDEREDLVRKEIALQEQRMHLEREENEIAALMGHL